MGWVSKKSEPGSLVLVNPGKLNICAPGSNVLAYTLARVALTPKRKNDKKKEERKKK